jgi:orotidine-5'-phosphate decarboxylase
LHTAVVDYKSLAAADRLIFALDVPTLAAARALIDTLGSAVGFYKIGLELLMSGEYFAVLDLLKTRGKRVFVDLKFFDVPATVAAAVRQLARWQVDFATIHGQDGMLKAAAEVKGDTRILGVTALTSLDQGDLDRLGFRCDPEALVLSRARAVLDAGCDGVISSGLEVAALRREIDARLLVVCPGIRPVQNDDDQKRTVDVHQAFVNGADYIVVGRPIRDAADPNLAALMIRKQVERAFIAAA